MATPTPSKSLAADLTPGTSSAVHLAAFSPPTTHPRSVVQSPAYYKKSPASAAFGSSHLHHGGGGSSSSILPSHPTGGALSFDSPSAAALGLKLDLAPADAIITAQYSLPDDDELRRRMDTILARLREAPGRISPEGIETLAKRAGLDHFTSGEVLTVAGTSLLIEITFKGKEVANVDISFPGSLEPVTSAVADAATVLKRNLSLPEGTPAYNSSLKSFEANLERLAKLDRLSIPSVLNCFEAVVGIYKSLRRLFDYEKGKVASSRRLENASPREGHSEADEAEAEVLCKKSGRPVLHSGGSVGLAINYWASSQSLKSTADKKRKPKLWSLLIECEDCAAALYPSVRSSDKWLPAEVEGKLEVDANEADVFNASSGAAAATSSSPTINWLEPPIISVPPTSNDGASNVVNLVAGTAPNVRFVAKLDPPLVVPLHVAYEILAFVGVVVPHEPSPPIFDQLLIPKGDWEGQVVEGATRVVEFERTVKIKSEADKDEFREQKVGVYVHRQDYGKVLTEFPFSHPQQLVGVLPILRQYARFSDVISSSISTELEMPQDQDAAISRTQANADEEADEEILLQDDSSNLLDKFLDSDPNHAPNPNSKAIVDVSFTMQPVPQISCMFNSPISGQPAVFFRIDIEQNGELKPHEGDISNRNELLKNQLSPKELVRALTACEDLGALAESLRRDTEVASSKVKGA